MSTPTGNRPGRPRKEPDGVELREHVTIRVRPGATEMLRAVAASTGVTYTELIRRYIAEGLSREADKLT